MIWDDALEMEKDMFQNHRVIGILAHVDAGKTTLAEALLYTAGVLRKAGRVDHQDAFLDNYALERQRGITIFSKQAMLSWTGKRGRGEAQAAEGEELRMTLLDTPGHVDFSAEMERTLQVLDYAILVISGADGVQGHTQTLWGLLKRYDVPTFLFVNKMDQEGTDELALLRELQEKLNENCVTFSSYEAVRGKENLRAEMVEQQAFYETVSMCSEALMEEFLVTGSLQEESIGAEIAERRLFPVYFGSALRCEGVEELLDGIAAYSLAPEYPEEFGARVYKISRDKQGNRLTHLKVTGGTLKAKQIVGNVDLPGEGTPEKQSDAGWTEKVDQIRCYNGGSFEVRQEVPAGAICVVTGLTRTTVGEGLGMERGHVSPSLEPVMTYRLKLPEGTDPVTALMQLRRLEEEEPLLHVVWKEQLKEIHVQTMGEVQIEILKNLLLERFGLEVEFENGSIVYKETIAEPVLGVGHFEPLRHYAEVQLLLEPGERGSGLQFASYVGEDELDKNWQRLILTHLEERSHPGVLVGGEITDMRISIVGGRSHIKHTEGGDFRQATYRAIRQGLRSAKNVLLEPVFEFTLEIPAECLGRAMTDIQRMQGNFDPSVQGEQLVTLHGTAPVAKMQDYQREVISYSKGQGKLSCVLKGYEPCREAQEVLQGSAYDPEGDLENPTGSVFCSHGVGTVVPWDQVWEYAHVPLRTDFLEAARRFLEENREGHPAGEAVDHAAMQEWMKERADRAGRKGESGSGTSGRSTAAMERVISQEEIDEIFTQGRKNQNRKENDRKGYRRYHRGNRRGDFLGGQGTGAGSRRDSAGNAGSRNAESRKESCILVDGYNVIHAWPHLSELLDVNIGSARDRLIEEMSNYQGYVGGTLILVFDAYKVKGNPGSIQKWNNIYVVYTKEAETADQYIEKTVHEMASKYQVTVATSDGLEQMIIWGEGAARMSSLGLWEEYERRKAMAREQYGIQSSGDE